MPRYGLLGSTGFTGRLVLSALIAHGVDDLRLGGRDVQALRRAARDAGVADAEVVRVDTTAPAEVDAFVSGLDVLLTTVGPFLRSGREVVRACVEHRVPYVDSTGEQGFLAWIDGTWHERAVAAGVPLIPAAGFDFVPGDLLASRAGSHLTSVDEIHVSYGLPRTSDLVRGWSRGTRTTMGEVLTEPMIALVGGVPVEELAGERRRLAWFPRPAGPRHAAAIPGGEPFSVPRHLPEVDEVRTYLALPSLAAELLQGVATWGRRPAVARRVAAMLQAPGDPSEARRAATRWVCIAEAEDRTAGEVSRAWAYGTDLYRFTAEAMVLLASRSLGGGVTGGVLAPAQVAPAAELLDELSRRTDLTWSVVPPGER